MILFPSDTRQGEGEKFRKKKKEGGYSHLARLILYRCSSLPFLRFARTFLTCLLLCIRFRLLALQRLLQHSLVLFPLALALSHIELLLDPLLSFPLLALFLLSRLPLLLHLLHMPDIVHAGLVHMPDGVVRETNGAVLHALGHFAEPFRLSVFLKGECGEVYAGTEDASFR